MTKIDLRRITVIELDGEGWIEIKGENSKFGLYFDGADIMKINHNLHDTKKSIINVDNSFITEKETKIIIELNDEDIY